MQWGWTPTVQGLLRSHCRPLPLVSSRSFTPMTSFRDPFTQACVQRSNMEPRALVRRFTTGLADRHPPHLDPDLLNSMQTDVAPEHPTQGRTESHPSYAHLRAESSTFPTFSDDAPTPEEYLSNPAPSATELAFEQDAPKVHLPPTAGLRASEISAAAAKAVRLSFAPGGSPAAAYHVVRSLSASYYPYPARIERFLTAGDKFIDFGLPVSPRLAAHALLHGLLRTGHVKRASVEAARLMRGGVRIRGRTLDALVHAAAFATPTRAQPLPPPPFRGSRPQHMALSPASLADPVARYALLLLVEAREHGHHRTEQMFGALVNACLLRGQVIFAAVLLSVLVKDWQLHKAALAAAEAAATAAQAGEPAAHAPAYLTRLAVNPSPYAFSHVLKRVDAVFDAVFSGALDRSDPTFREAVQAICTIASLIEDRSIPFGRIGHIVAVMYACPRSNVQAWVPDKDTGQLVRVGAYKYLHRVLWDLAHNLPARALPVDPQLTRPPLMRPLDRRAYASMLHYAFRHRLSPELGSKILHHMLEERQPRVRPDTTIVNIIMRSGTLLRRNDITEKAIQLLSQVREIAAARSENGSMEVAQEMEQTDVELSHQEAFLDRNPEVTVDVDRMMNDRPRARHAPSPTSAHHSPSSTREAVTPPSSSVKRKAQRNGFDTLAKERFDMELHPNALRQLRLEADSATIVAYITHLVSTGRPGEIVTLLFDLIPELSVIDHPSWGELSPKERVSARRASREAAVQRGVALGPHFFAAVLNATHKAGKTGLSERVWLLGKACERASWLAASRGAGDPWCMPVEAYTAMMQVYTQEARRGLEAVRGRGGLADYHARLVAEGNGWAPRDKARVKGWARVVLYRERLAPDQLPRRVAALKAGRTLLGTLIDAARALQRSLGALTSVDLGSADRPEAWRRLRLPRPDARFFNAALTLFARLAPEREMPRRPRRMDVLRRLAVAEEEFETHGLRPPGGGHALRELSQLMAAHGHAIPLGLRHLLVGVELPPLQRAPPSDHSLDMRLPFAFRRLRVRRALRDRLMRLPTVKERGLPLSNDWRPRRTRRRWTWREQAGEQVQEDTEAAPVFAHA